MPHHRIIIWRFKRFYVIAGLFLIGFCPPATALYESLFTEITGPIIFRCETGVRYFDEHGRENSMSLDSRDETQVKMYFHFLRTEKPITSKRYLGPFATHHDVFQKDVYSFFIPETSTDTVRYLGYLNDVNPSEPIFGSLVLKAAFYTKNDSSERHQVVVVSKNREAIVLFEIEETNNYSYVKVFTFDGRKFSVQASGPNPYIDMGFCEQSVLAD